MGEWPPRVAEWLNGYGEKSPPRRAQSNETYEKNIHNLTYKQIHTQQYKHTNAHKKYAIHHDACITNRVAVSFFPASHASKGIAQDNVRICASIYAFPSPCPLQSERPPSKQLQHELRLLFHLHIAQGTSRSVLY